MRRRFLQGVFLLAAAMAVSIPVSAQAPDSWLGTWKLNVAKSKYDPATAAPKGQTAKMEAIAGGGMRTVTDGVDAQGKPTHTELTTMFDGKPSEVKGAADANTTRVYKRIDRNTYEFVTSVGGKVTLTSRSVTSADGKSRTLTGKGTHAKGEAVSYVIIYERQ